MGKNIAVITAGGSGKRFLLPVKKQFVELAGRPILFWTIDKFLQFGEIDEIIITLPTDDFPNYQTAIQKEFPQKNIFCVIGGTERQQSVYNALSICPSDTEYVFIHDGVRPFITLAEIVALLEIARQSGAVVPACQVKDTIKEISEQKIKKTLTRRQLIAVQTPQVFRYELIMECHRKALVENLICTDDAALLEHYGYSVQWLECSPLNIKITEPFDLHIAELIMKKQTEK
ncbi:MAG TPA: 2-C-methyl-D-erythritol 4-phosphate cytidylyltransferase [Candidatus Cloacimonadota bacterium]|nr:2-C-methyl-D-erythritol 4-phosphate cytidylyltransferase [Candidatus Cloacimonadota bacterium]